MERIWDMILNIRLDGNNIIYSDIGISSDDNINIISKMIEYSFIY